MSQTYGVDDLVWAKMKNYAPWPGLVADPQVASVKPPRNKTEVYHWIFFFGTANFAWIEEANLKPYRPFKEKMMSKYMPAKVTEIKKKTLADAVNQIENYIKEKEKNPNYKPYADVKDIAFDNIRNDKPMNSDKKRKSAVDKKSSTPKVPAKRLRSGNEEVSDMSFKSNNSVTSSIENSYDMMEETKEEKELMDLKTKAVALESKDIVPLKKKIGFLGVGKMGAGFVKNLIHTGHDVTIWDHRIEKCETFQKEIGATVADTPADVVQQTEIIFSCLSEPRVSRHVIYSNCGVRDPFNSTKGFIELSTVNTEVSLDISDPITKVGGRYLEAQIQGDIKQANQGTVIFITAGDESLFYEVQSCFKAMGAYSYYISSNIGDACIMNLSLQTLKASALAGLAEAMALVDRFKLKFQDFLEIFDRSEMKSEFLKEKHHQIVSKKYENQLTLKYLQKDLRLTLDVADQIKQPLPMAANANEIFKQAIRNGFGNKDASAIYEYIRH